MADRRPVKFTSVTDLTPLPGQVTPPDPAAMEAERQALREQAYAEGFQQGLRDAEQQAAPALTALAEAEKIRRTAIDTISRRLEHEALELAFALAEQLVDDHITHTQQAVLPVVTRALDFVVDAESVQVLLAPEDLPIVQSALEQLSGQVRGELRLRADPDVARGGCRVQTDIGDVDATRQSRAQHLRQRLEELRSERGAR